MAGLLFVILAGAAVTPAAPITPNEWINSREQPKTALQVAERGAITYTLHVAPDGTPVRCETPTKTGLDLKVCELVMKRARFVAAKDDQGHATFGVHDGVASFLMPGKGRQRPDPSKLVVTAESLPEGAASPAYAKVAFLVDGQGRISQCASTTAERRRFMHTIEALGPAACESLARDYRAVPARNAAGDPVSSVQVAIVRFELRSAQ